MCTLTLLRNVPSTLQNHYFTELVVYLPFENQIPVGASPIDHVRVGFHASKEMYGPVSSPKEWV